MTQKSHSKLKKFNFKSIFSLSLNSKKRNNLPRSTSDCAGNFEFDAVPDAPRKGSERSNSSTSLPDSEGNGRGNFEQNLGKEDDYGDHSKNKKTGEEFNFTSKEEKNKENYIHKSVTNINVVNGTGIHIGNVINTNFNLGACDFQEGKETKKSEKTIHVKDLLKCEDKVKRAHLEFLSAHFGNRWEKIGAFLKISNAELEEIKSQFRNQKERGYRMLVQWSQQQEEGKATVGFLSKLLWKSNIKNAKEAVEELSRFIQEFN